MPRFHNLFLSSFQSHSKTNQPNITSLSPPPSLHPIFQLTLALVPISSLCLSLFLPSRDTNALLLSRLPTAGYLTHHHHRDKMGHHTRRDSAPAMPSNPSPLQPHHHNDDTSTGEPNDLPSPFGTLDGLDNDDFREIAYEVFFTACRSSPGFGGRGALNYYSSASTDGGCGGGEGSAVGSPVKEKGVGMAVTSRVKRALGLKMLRRSQSRRTSSVGVAAATAVNSSPSSPAHHHHHGGGGGGSPGAAFSTVPGPGRTRRPMTSAEIMRQQMRVTEQSDNRLRKTLMRTLVGQVRIRSTFVSPCMHIKVSNVGMGNIF